MSGMLHYRQKAEIRSIGPPTCSVCCITFEIEVCAASHGKVMLCGDILTASVRKDFPASMSLK